MKTKLFIFLTSFLFLGSDCENDRINALDNGRIVVDAPDGSEMELRICEYPMTISTYDGLPVAEAVAQWNEWVGLEVFVVDDVDPRVVPVIGYYLYDPDEREEAGLATIDYDSTGCTLRVDITVALDITYDADTTMQVLLHELGHAIGLANDPGPPETVDLRSIMSLPIDPLGVLTEHDRQLLLE